MQGAPIKSHLLFAYDRYLFFKANDSEAMVVKRILQEYVVASGQLVNLHINIRLPITRMWRYV